MTASNVVGITVLVPSSEDYTAPANSTSRIASKVRRLFESEVIGKDGQPHAVAAPVDPVVEAAVPGAQPGQVPRMADALMAAAAAVGADVTSLVDSASFTRTLGSISPADTAGLVGAIQEAMATNPSLGLQPVTPGMRPNPAQGSSASGGAVPSHPKSTLERIHDQTAKAANQPLPPGSTVV